MSVSSLIQEKSPIDKISRIGTHKLFFGIFGGGTYALSASMAASIALADHAWGEAQDFRNGQLKQTGLSVMESPFIWLDILFVTIAAIRFTFLSEIDTWTFSQGIG